MPPKRPRTLHWVGLRLDYQPISTGRSLKAASWTCLYNTLVPCEIDMGQCSKALLVKSTSRILLCLLCGHGISATGMRPENILELSYPSRVYSSPVYIEQIYSLVKGNMPFHSLLGPKQINPSLIVWNKLGKGLWDGIIKEACSSYGYLHPQKGSKCHLSPEGPTRCSAGLGGYREIM